MMEPTDELILMSLDETTSVIEDKDDDETTKYQNEVLFTKLYQYYSGNDMFIKLKFALDKYSLRIIDWFITNYAPRRLGRPRPPPLPRHLLWQIHQVPQVHPLGHGPPLPLPVRQAQGVGQGGGRRGPGGAAAGAEPHHVTRDVPARVGR